MNLIKKQQKWIALFVALTFMWLLQVSIMPLAAADSAEEIGSAKAEQGPDYVEAVGQKDSPAAKKSILPYVLIGVGVLAVAAVLILVSSKSKYDPVGTWSGPMSNQVQQEWTATVVFSGGKNSGSTIYSDPWESDRPGTYTVDEKSITFTAGHASGHGSTITFTGMFESKDLMVGTWQNDSDSSVNGLWKLIRAGTAAAPVPNR